jgi:AraC-like DNA-binding protein
VATVAASVGFQSTDAFRRAFERRFGITPRDFRAGRASQSLDYAQS